MGCKDQATGGAARAPQGGGEDDPRWQRIVVPLKEFAANPQQTMRRLVGPGIPVPLFPGETEDEYEQSFLKTLEEEFKKHANARNTFAHVFRTNFAMSRANWCSRRRLPKEFTTCVAAGDVESCCVEELPREVLCATVPIGTHAYRAQIRSGFFARLKRLSRTETFALFGNVVPPIFMPNACGAKSPKREARFTAWLMETRKTTLEDRVRRAHPMGERRCLIEFAAAMAFVDLTTENKRKSTTQMVASTKKRKELSDANEASSGCQGCESPAECIACGCSKCLANGARLLKDKASNVPSKKLHDRETSSPESKVTSSAVFGDKDNYPATIESPDEHVKAQLEWNYDEINHRVVMNEKVLEENAAGLAAAPVMDIQETSQLLEENEELRQLIEAEIDNRNTALALLVMELWRDDVSGLLSIVKDPTATNVLHIHRACHHKCSSLGSQIKEMRRRVDQLKAALHSVEAPVFMEEMQPLLARTERELMELVDQRRRQWVRLIHFDERLRLLIHELLQQL